MAIRQRGFLPRLLPKIPSDRQGVDLEVLPPCDFIAGLLQLPVMVATKGNGELVAHFKTDGSGAVQAAGDADRTAAGHR
jgi:hypothetical protein